MDAATVASDAVSGAATGSALGPWATAAGAAIGGAIGIAQIISGNRAIQRARKLVPPRVDLQERNYLGELDSLRKGYGTGAAYKEALRQLDLNAADAGAKALEASGGYGGAALNAIEGINANEGNNYGKIFSEADNTKLAYEQLYGNTLDKMVKRRGDLDVMRYAQELNEGVREKSAGEQDAVNAGDTLATSLTSLL